MNDLPRVKGKFANIWKNPTRQRINGKKSHLPEHGQWRSMYYRTTTGSTMQRKSPTYIDCIRDASWDSYDNYIEWAREQIGFLERDEDGRIYQLDKDILLKGNKIYCPELCVFVPAEINAFLNSSAKKRGNYPIGVSFHKRSGRFMSKAGNERLGYYTTINDAFSAYKLAKENQAKNLALKYFNRVDPRVTEALNNFEVSIDD